MGLRRYEQAVGDGCSPHSIENSEPPGLASASPAVSLFPGESSPPKNRLDCSSAGAAEVGRASRPSGTYPSPATNPALKRRVIVVCPFWTETDPVAGRPVPVLIRYKNTRPGQITKSRKER